jgi:signal transduction histidine kinase/CheY-like chemotaxis protein
MNSALLVFRACFGLLITLLAIATTAVRAETVALDTRAEKLDLSNSLELLHDPTGQIHYTEVFGLTNEFRHVQRKDLVQGFNAGVFWLRFSLVHTGAQPVTRWLVVGTAKINQVTLYLRGNDDWQVMHSGRSVPMTQQPIIATEAAFPIILAPGENREVLVRVVARGATDMSTTLWEPQAYRFAGSERKLLTIAMLSGMLVSSGLALIVFIRLRETPYLWLCLLLITVAGVESARENLIAFYLWPSNMPVPLQVLSIFAGLAMFALAKVVANALDLPRQMPPADKLLLALRWTGLFAVAVSGFDYGLGVRLLAIDAAILHLASLILPVVLWRRGYYPAGWFAATFALGLLLETARQLANLGILPWAAAMNFSMAGYLLSAPFILIGMIEQTRKLSEQLAVAEQLHKAKSAFLSRVSHELRSPLNTILGFARMLRRGSARLSIDEGAAGIEKEALRLLDLIDELLDESRAAAGKLSVSPVPMLFPLWLDELSADAEIFSKTQGNRFICKRASALPAAILADSQRLRQVLDNLLHNANRHTRQGEIQLTSTAQIEGSTAILYFAVCDNGEGMTPEQMKVIFEPFVRGPNTGLGDYRRQRGFGLGLSISRELICQMGGDISVTSEPNKGSCFSFTLHCPLVAATEESTAKHDLQAAAARPLPAATPLQPQLAMSSPHVLLVDDDQQQLRLLDDLLSDAGFITHQAESGKIAEEQLRNIDSDVVVTDQMMADGDGWYLLRQVRRSTRHVPVVMLSAALPQRPDDFPAGIEFDAILRKPALSEDLLAILWGLILKVDADETAPSAAQWQALATLANDGDVSGIEEWIDALGDPKPGTERIALWTRTTLNRLDLGLLEQVAQKAAGQLKNSGNDGL